MLFIEPATTNLLTNPSFETDLDGWLSQGAGVTRTRVDTEAAVGSWSQQVDCDGSTQSQGVGLVKDAYAAVAGDVFTFQAMVKAPAGAPLRLWAFGVDSGGISGTAQPYAFGTFIGTGGWQYTELRYEMTDPLTAFVCFRVVTQEPWAGTFWIDAAQLEKAPFPTSYSDGSLGTGYAWTGTAHASSSTRAATIAKPGDPTLWLDPERGAIAVRAVMPTDPPTGNPTLFDIGNTTVGLDLVQVRLNGYETIEALYFHDNVAQQGIQLHAEHGVPGLGQLFDVHVWWDGPLFGAAIDTHDPIIDTRAAWGSPFSTGGATRFWIGSNRANASQWGERIGGVALLPKPPTDAERAAIKAITTWRWFTVAGGTP